MFSEKTSLVIPTRNRPIYLQNTLDQIIKHKVEFLEILVIDSSDKVYEEPINEIIKNYKIKYFHSQPSTSIQRNIGIENMSKESKFVMFLDDDITFEKDMFQKMNKTIIENADDENIIAYGFNQIQKIKKFDFIEKTKNIFLFNIFDLYHKTPGKVALSGWQTKILNIKRDLFVDWIYTTACIYKSNEINDLRFDVNFGKYGYLEDLDFSLNFYRSNKKILISADAKYFHPLSIDRSSFKFGVYETRNRYKIVKKYKLSKIRFFFMTLIRTTILLTSIFIFKKKSFNRGLGNIYGIINCYKY